MDADLARAYEKIIVALDTTEIARAIRWVDELHGFGVAFKVSWGFLLAHGIEGVRAVQEAGTKRLFIDGKFADTQDSIGEAVYSACRLGPWMVSVHALSDISGMIAAREAAERYSTRTGLPQPKIVAITVLTNQDESALVRVGILGTMEEAVVRLAQLAKLSGLDGVVSSPYESAAIRRACGQDFLIVVPSIRPEGVLAYDQQRHAPPKVAIENGADYLVIGRAITRADNHAYATLKIADEIALASVK